MATIEFEKTVNNQVRYKWSTSPTSNFILNAMNTQIYSNNQRPLQNDITISINGWASDISFNLDQITTINGAPAPATVEETLLLLTDEVFGG